MLYETYHKGNYQVIKINEVLSLSSYITELADIVKDFLIKNIVNMAIHFRDGSYLNSGSAATIVRCWVYIKEKKGKIYPQITSVSVYNIQTEVVNDMFFIPYLIYDDLIDIFFYNIQLLNEGTPHVNLKRFQENSIINKRPKITTDKKENLFTRIEVETFL